MKVAGSKVHPRLLLTLLLLLSLLLPSMCSGSQISRRKLLLLLFVSRLHVPFREVFVLAHKLQSWHALPFQLPPSMWQYCTPTTAPQSQSHTRPGM